MLDGVEMLIDDGTMSGRGRRMMLAMAATAPRGSVRSAAYAGKHRLLMMYGAGLASRVDAIKRHQAAGGIVATWDLGYWDREDAMRLSIGKLHPTADLLQMAPAVGSRRQHVLREDANATGPILLVGLGTKSCALYGLTPMQWEREKLAELRRRFPGRPIVWRPKGKRKEPLPDTEMSDGTPIETALRDCSLVVCRHSNVAVDACIAGVPVECDDGAALALYRGNPTPTPAERAEFLRRLGWWNWRPSEARAAWDWIGRVAR